VVQIATAPFRLLGRIVAAGDRVGIDITPVRFTPGSVRLDEAAEAQIDRLAGVLRERPGLKITLTAVGDVAADAEALRAERLDQQLLALGGDQERDTAVEALFQEAFGRAGPTLPIAEQLQRLLRAQTVTQRELRALAERRGLAVYDALVERAIPRDRIFLGPGRMIGAEARDGEPSPRIEIAILSPGGD
jgi:hypothetical protein